MWSSLVVVGMLAVASLTSLRQVTTQYLIRVRILAGNPAEAGSVRVLAAPVFRVPAGRPGVMDLGDATNGLRMFVTPTDLGSEKVALRVVVESRRGARIQGTTFDLLSGQGAAFPTVALRDAAGAFIADDQGRQLFVEMETTIRR